MSSNIDRIEAQRDMRSLSVAISGTSGEAANQHRERLDMELGDIVKTPAAPRDVQRDETGFQELKALAAAINTK